MSFVFAKSEIKNLKSKIKNSEMLQKYLAAVVAMLLMFAFMSFILVDDLKIPQRESLMPISVKNKVNICMPEDDENI